MAGRTPGIQKLLEAEARAAEKVKAARNRKAQTMKRAGEEAQLEVAQFKRKLEEEFQQKQKQNDGSKNEGVAQLQAETDAKLKELETVVTKNKKFAIENLLEKVKAVDPQIHQNFNNAEYVL